MTPGIAGRWAALLFAILLVAIGTLQLASNLYYRVATISAWYSDVRRAVMASEVATSLRQHAAAAYGARLAAVVGDADVFDHRYVETLRDAPADPYRWAEYARALALVGDFGPRFDRAIDEAQQRAPRSPAVHLALADVRWRHGAQLTDAQLEVLYPSLVRTMQNQGQRQKLLDRIVRSRRQSAFCAEYGSQFSGGRWCARIERDLAECTTTREPRKLRWCRKVDALP